jgi:hypothetical protein
MIYWSIIEILLTQCNTVITLGSFQPSASSIGLKEYMRCDGN